MTKRQINAAVKRGAKLLDERLGRSWRRKIRRRDLDMDSGFYEGPGDCGCILAQLHESWDDGLLALGVPYKDADRFGFGGETDGGTPLRNAWLQELRAS